LFPRFSIYKESQLKKIIIKGKKKVLTYTEKCKKSLRRKRKR
jgi:hypothetical protein